MRIVILILLVIFQLTILPVMAKVARDGGAPCPPAAGEGGVTVAYKNVTGSSVVKKMRSFTDVAAIRKSS